MLEEQRKLIHRLVAREPGAGDEFYRIWNSRICDWIAGQAPYEKVEEYAQEVWAHLMAGNWMRLLQWHPLYDDEAWHERSLEGYLHQITVNKASDLWRAEPPVLPRGLDPVDIIDRTTQLGRDPLVEAERGRLMRAYYHCTEWFRNRDHLAIQLWWEGHNAQFIAEQVRTNANNVYQRRSYLLRRLRECLVEKLPEYFRHV